jgi:hypothetical protein
VLDHILLLNRLPHSLDGRSATAILCKSVSDRGTACIDKEGDGAGCRPKRELTITPTSKLVRPPTCHPVLQGLHRLGLGHKDLAPS